MSNSALTLTKDQQAAKDAFLSLLYNKDRILVIEGFSGCGKSTLIKTLLEDAPDYLNLLRSMDDSIPQWDFRLTATTNKAADNLRQITKYEVSTIHSLLGIRPVYDPKENTRRMYSNKKNLLSDSIVFIDEASYLNAELLDYIVKTLTPKNKIVFLGDPAQLTAVKSSNAPVFMLGYPTVRLTEVVRQANGNQIIEVSGQFRDAVMTGKFFSFLPNGQHIERLSRNDFDRELQAEYLRPDWQYSDSKVLVWTNNAAIKYNQAIRAAHKGDHTMAVGDYVIVNSFVKPLGASGIRADSLVMINEISPRNHLYGVAGHYFTIQNSKVFVPDNWKLAREVQKQFAAFDDWHNLERAREIEEQWADLRSVYACTIDKSQGSTYKKVFIDLDDIKKCNDPNRIARMLYVGISRASEKCYLVGDLV